MNKTEARYADRLTLLKRAGVVREFYFESWKLRLGDTLFYTPDFIVWLDNDTVECHEVKGFWRDDARVKIVAAATQYPFLRFIAIQWKNRDWRIEEIKSHG